MLATTTGETILGRKSYFYGPVISETDATHALLIMVATCVLFDSVMFSMNIGLTFND